MKTFLTLHTFMEQRKVLETKIQNKGNENCSMPIPCKK